MSAGLSIIQCIRDQWIRLVCNWNSLSAFVGCRQAQVTSAHLSYITFPYLNLQVMKIRPLSGFLSVPLVDESLHPWRLVEMVWKSRRVQTLPRWAVLQWWSERSVQLSVQCLNLKLSLTDDGTSFLSFTEAITRMTCTKTWWSWQG